MRGLHGRKTSRCVQKEVMGVGRGVEWELGVREDTP